MDVPNNERFRQNFVAGGWEPSREGGALDVHDPRDGTKIAEVARSSPRDVDHAVQVAQSAAVAWANADSGTRRTHLDEALDRLRASKDALVDALVRDAGLPGGAAKSAVGRLLIDAASAIRHLPAQALRAGTSVPHPGVVAAHLHGWTAPPSAFADVFFDLAAGRAVIVKPSELNPLSGTVLVSALSPLPPGTITLLQGTEPDVDAHLAAIAGVDRVVLHGTRAAAAAAMRAAAATLKRLHLRTCGPHRLIVFDGANTAALAKDVEDILAHRTASPYASRVVVHVERPAYASTVDALSAVASALSPAKADATLQPLASEVAVSRAVQLFEAWAERGATLHAGGTANDRRAGHWLAPAVLEGPTASELFQDEDSILPLVVVEPFDDPKKVRLSRTPTDAAPVTVWRAGSVKTWPSA